MFVWLIAVYICFGLLVSCYIGYRERKENPTQPIVLWLALLIYSFVAILWPFVALLFIENWLRTDLNVENDDAVDTVRYNAQADTYWRQ